MYPDDCDGDTQIGSSQLLLSCMMAFVTALLLSTSVGPAIVKPLLLDGSLISNGRFAFVYEGYETVGEDGAITVVGIGSSILMAGMNGTCMQEESEIENARFYNFAMSGGKPYSEMIQIPALIDANPDVVMVEVGPNSLYGWNGSRYIEGLTDYNEFRFQLMSMGMSSHHFGDWYAVLDEIDRQWVGSDQLGKTDAWSEYTRDAIEEYLRREIDDTTNARDVESTAYVPPAGSAEWHKYLSEPNYSRSKFDTMNSSEIRDNLDEIMPRKSKQGVYNPLGDGTQNHRALDYIVHELLSASIEVVLLGIPHHPWVNGYLSEGQLDGMNSTYEKYESIEGVTSLQMYWEEWPAEAFSDRNHLDADGREVFCKRVTPVIDAVYSGGDPSEVEVLPSMFEITNNIRQCEGSGIEFIFTGENLQFEAEDYSTCTLGKTGIESIWEFETRLIDFSGDGYVAALPDGKHYLGDTTNGPHIVYNLTIENIGIHHIWIRMAASDGRGDSIHIGLNGEPLTLGGYGFSTENNSEWNWEHIELNFTSNGANQLDIWMREDGVMVDSLIITNVAEFTPDNT